MWEAIFKFINDNYPVVGLLIIAVSIALYINNKYHHWAGRVKKNEEDCRKIDSVIAPQLTSISGSVSSLNTNFKVLVTHLQSKVTAFDVQLFMSQSPISLTPLGWEVLRVVDGAKYIDDNETELLNEMDLQGVKTALDTQTIAPIVITKISANNNFKHIKDYLFNNPNYKSKDYKDKDGQPLVVALDMNKIAHVMGVYLRDKYLRKHPELNPEDIPDIKSPV